MPVDAAPERKPKAEAWGGVPPPRPRPRGGGVGGGGVAEEDVEGGGPWRENAASSLREEGGGGGGAGMGAEAALFTSKRTERDKAWTPPPRRRGGRGVVPRGIPNESSTSSMSSLGEGGAGVPSVMRSMLSPKRGEFTSGAGIIRGIVSVMGRIRQRTKKTKPRKR